jgi:general secretion pathway protein D
MIIIDRSSSAVIRSTGRRPLALWLASAMAPFLLSCASPEPRPLDAEFRLTQPVSDMESLQAVAAEGAGAPEADAEVPVVRYRGNDRQVNIPPVREPIRLLGKDVSLNFEQAPLEEVVHAVLGDILELDYIVDGPIKGQVTLRTRTPIPRDQLLKVLESLLQANGMLLIRGSDDRFLITGSQRASQLQPSVSNPNNPDAGFSTIVVPLRFISASNMAEILKPVAPESAFVRIDNTRNLLMLAGTRGQLDGWLDMVRTFDVDLLKGMSMGMFPLVNSNVEDIGTALAELLGAGGKDGGGSLGQLVRVIPVKRLNSLLIVTPRAHYLDSIETWIKRLDSAPDSSYEKRLYVYAVQNTSAAHLAELLTKIYTDTGGGVVTASRTTVTGVADNSVAPGLAMESLGGGGTGSGGLGNGGLGGGGGSIGGGFEAGDVNRGFGSAGGERSGPTVAALKMADAIGGNMASAMSEVRVVADEENNSLMIHATGRQYRTIQAALEKLDRVATQVIIEASILEVSLTDDLRYGLEWTFKNGLGSDYDGVGVLANAASGPGGLFPGFNYTITNSIGDISAVLNALGEASLLNVISTPSVMVLDNHTAQIHVGEQVPVSMGQSVVVGGAAVERIVYRDTGVKLMVKPSVNAGGLITMDVQQSVTDIGEIETSTGERKFLNRDIASRVAVRSNESVVLGGLIRERGATGSSGLPGLHKIPVFGALFGSKAEENSRTELLVIITPRAIYNETELRQVSEEMRSQIRHMELLELPPD